MIKHTTQLEKMRMEKEEEVKKKTNVPYVCVKFSLRLLLSPSVP